jgi:hypothetical protein
MTEINAKYAYSEIGGLTEDVRELSECKQVLCTELVNEVENIEELGTIILQLKRNLHEEKREKEKAVQTYA